jgi:hypothetical protein
MCIYTDRCTSIRIARASPLIRLTASSVRDFRDSTVTGSGSGAKRTEILSDHNFGLRLLHISGDGRYHICVCIYIYMYIYVHTHTFTSTAGTRKASVRYIFSGQYIYVYYPIEFWVTCPLRIILYIRGNRRTPDRVCLRGKTLIYGKLHCAALRTPLNCCTGKRRLKSDMWN